MKTNKGFVPVIIILILIAVISIALYGEKQARDEKKPISKNDCTPAGCYSLDCVDPNLYLPPNCITINPTPEQEKEIACYKKSKCERQLDNKCGWTQTVELKSCIDGVYDDVECSQLDENKCRNNKNCKVASGSSSCKIDFSKNDITCPNVTVHNYMFLGCLKNLD
ncbi:MAG: hypothetical protein WCX46_03195 [Candidatus Paceibacterota bacterium]